MANHIKNAQSENIHIDNEDFAQKVHEFYKKYDIQYEKNNLDKHKLLSHEISMVSGTTNPKILI